MEIYCTRPGCPRPNNHFPDLDDKATLKTAQQKFCTACGMPLILVGRYIPSRLLGQGGFGAAFLARDRYTPALRQCVVKQFQPSGDLNPQQLKIAQDLFEREAEVLEQLGSTHPQIPDLFAFFPLITPSIQFGKEDQFFYLVQEFIDGEDLEQELQRNGPFSEAQALEVLQEILNVLKFVHENGSIHRDIKPSNIMRDKKGRLYLLDFGAVKQVTQGEPAEGGTGRSTGIYSMGFAPPEQMSGGQVYPSTDLYALAVTVITLLTGKEAGELYDSYNNNWNWRNSAQVSDTLANVLDRMLLSAPNQRFQSAQEALDALSSRRQPPPPPSVTLPPPVQVSVPPATVPPVTQSPSPPPITPPFNPPVTSSPQSLSRQPTSLIEILGGGAFTGFEGGLLFIALSHFLGTTGISIGLLGMIVGGLAYAQYRRIIEGKDLLIIAGITAAVVLFFLRGSLSIENALIISVLAGLGGIAATALFRLVYLLLSRLL
ncbi:MAG TPA: serine/threonine-protein kinase [Candidatus Sericytochromatia bacterium]|jgi:serine/threonine protein kinase